MTEYLDVIDEKGNVLLEKVSRNVVHRLGLPHAAVFIVLFDENGRILLQRRSLKMSANPGQWTYSSSGHAVSGESQEDAAKRESFEEIGLKDITLHKSFERRIWEKKNEKHYENEFGTYFIGRVKSNYSFTIDEDEVMQVKFFTKDEVRDCEDDMFATKKEDFLKIFELY